jgi:hypothetical protein
MQKKERQFLQITLFQRILREIGPLGKIFRDPFLETE